MKSKKLLDFGLNFNQRCFGSFFPFSKLNYQSVRCSRAGIGNAKMISSTGKKSADLDNFHEYGVNQSEWLDRRTQTARHIGMKEDKNWPLLRKIAASGEHNANTTKKVRHALKQIDRLLDVFEPGQLALSFNGGKDSTVLMHLVKAACEEHATHRFSHVQPIWFQDPQHEFPAMVNYVKQTAEQHFSDQDGLKTVHEENLNRLWTMHIRSPQVRPVVAQLHPEVLAGRNRPLQTRDREELG
jgi:hypothetical protein